MNNIQRVKIHELIFKELLGGVKHCVSRDGQRPTLEFIRINVDNGALVFYALDGYRAGRVETHDFTSDGNFTCYIKPFAFKPTKEGKEYVNIEFDGETAKVEVITQDGKVEHTFLQPQETNVFDIEKIYHSAREHDRELGFNARYMVEACKSLNYPLSMGLTVIETKSNNQEAFIIRGKSESVTNEQLILPIRFGDKKED